MQNTFTVKRVVIGLVSLIVLFFAVGAIWYYFLRSGGTEDGGGFLDNLFPDSEEREFTDNEEDKIEGGKNEGSLPNDPNAMRGDSYQIVDAPIAGATFYKNKIRFVDKATGNIVEMDTDGRNKSTLSSANINGVYDAQFSTQGNKVIIRTFDANRSQILVATITGSSTVSTINLPAGTKDITFSPKGDRIAYVLPSGDDASVITATTDNKSPTTRLKMKYSSWKLKWIDENNIYLLTAPSSYADGFLFKLSLAGNSLTKIFGPLRGLDVSLNSSNIIFSHTNDSEKSVSTLISNISGGNLGQMIVKTIADKCFWSKKVKDIVYCSVPLPMPQATYPDDWHMGKVSFGDTIIKINITSRAVTTLLLPEKIDAIKMFLSEDETALFFLNKADESLWLIKIP